MQESEAYCERCERYRLVRRETVQMMEYIGAVALMTFTCLLAAPLVVPYLIARECGMGRPWLCTRCGRKC
jgi:hypothetical protein